MEANTNPTPQKEATVATITNTFRSFDNATIYVLSDGRAIRESVTGLMLLDALGGRFVRWLDTIEEVAV